MASLATFLGTSVYNYFKPLKNGKVNKVVKIVNRASLGVLISTTIGALFFKGGNTPDLPKVNNSRLGIQPRQPSHVPVVQNYQFKG
jgi:uncharacterized membrane protein